MIAAGRGAKPARVDFREVVADRTKNDALFHITHRGNQTFEIDIGDAHEMKRQPLRGLVSDTRQAFQFVDQFGYWFRVLQHLINT